MTDQLAGTRPLVVYRKEQTHVVAMVRGHDPIILCVGDKLTVVFEVNEGLDLEQVELPGGGRMTEGFKPKTVTCYLGGHGMCRAEGCQCSCHAAPDPGVSARAELTSQYETDGSSGALPEEVKYISSDYIQEPAWRASAGLSSSTLHRTSFA